MPDRRLLRKEQSYRHSTALGHHRFLLLMIAGGWWPEGGKGRWRPEGALVTANLTSTDKTENQKWKSVVGGKRINRLEKGEEEYS